MVEWLNVSGGLDVPVDWNMTHREILRRGHAYVAKPEIMEVVALSFRVTAERAKPKD